MESKMECEICSKVRRVSEQLNELGLAAEYLGNRSTYASEHGSTTIRTEAIGDWLRLAAQLDKVEIDAWKFDGNDALYCETIADHLDDHSKHYTEHATALTRFIFVSNGLEEAYRLIDYLYEEVADRQGLARANRKKTASLRAVELIDDLFERKGSSVQPSGFRHLTGIFAGLFNEYVNEHGKTLTGIDPGSEGNESYALHLVRNLRNHVAHGTFPIGPPKDYGGFEDSEELKHLLNHACRIAALYIQVIFRGFSPGFQSEEFMAVLNAEGEEYEQFSEKCSLAYIRDIHMKGDFALSNGVYGFN